MDIAGQDGEIFVLVHKDGLVSSLIKVAGTSMPSVEVADVCYIEMPHEFRQISKRRFNKQMKMIVHQYIAVELDGVNVDRLVQLSEESDAISIITKDVLFFIAAAGYVINSVRILNAKWARHGRNNVISGGICQG